MRAPARLKTKAGHSPRARLHARWSPIGQRDRRSTAFRTLGVLLGIVMVLGLAADAYAQSFVGSLPSVTGLDAANLGGDVFIADRGGKLLADIADQGDRRIFTPLSNMSPNLARATVAIEDKTFYQNQGFDLQGIARAAIGNFRTQSITGGGSTITQQLAKQLFLLKENGTADRSYERKAKEVILAYQLTQHYTKDQILELYLNRAYYGAQAYGAQAASQTYFHKDAKDLDLAQAAMLAGLPQSPARWSPIVNPQDAKIRQRQVLDAMVRLGYATPEEEALAYEEQLQIFGPVNTFLAPHFVEYVQRELEQLGFKLGQQQLYVTTTLDYAKQQLGEQIVRDNLNANQWRDPGGQLDSSLVSVDPKTGQILVMVGSGLDHNSNGGQINETTRYVNPGSSVKPFTYGAVINARKATMATPIADSPSPLELSQGPGQDNYKVTNYDHGTHGVLPLKWALANSLNIPAVKAELSIGVPAVVEFWRSLGLRPWDVNHDPNGPVYNYGAALTLGGYAITTLQEAEAFATYAALGVYHEPEAILKVTDARGKVLYQANPDASKKQVIDPGVAYIMGVIMSDDNNRAMIFGRNGPLTIAGHRVAAKTGTTETWHDALTVGFTPDIATVMWMGDILDHPELHHMNQDAITVVAPAWHDYMTKVLASYPDHWVAPPSDVVQVGADWFLADTTKVDRLPNDNPTPKPTPVDYAIPGDPGGPQAIVPTPTPGHSPGPPPGH
jgi:membrane peptidoglycan carboxypeptidase